MIVYTCDEGCNKPFKGTVVQQHQDGEYHPQHDHMESLGHFDPWTGSMSPTRRAAWPL